MAKSLGFNIAAGRWPHVDLRAFAGPALERLPYSFRILLENALRAGAAPDAAAILAWLDRRDSAATVSFAPRRVLMHDTTAVPALADLAAMRDAIAEVGGDPSTLDVTCPVAVSVDHSLAVDRHGSAAAMRENMAAEIARNAERYRFLKWAGRTFGKLTVFPPGSGILHTINLEHLASVVDLAEERGGQLLVPDTMIGTDSHTPMIGALGVLGWGVGGLEAESALLGQPMPLRLPRVVGVRLTGRLGAGVMATDLALHVTAELRRLGVVGCFVEFHGPGLGALSVGMRAAVANMAPEYGATTGFFPIDDAVLRYLAATGRDEAHVARVAAFAQGCGLLHDPGGSPDYSTAIEIDLSALHAVAAGPRRPQDKVPLSRLGTGGAGPQAGRDVPENAVAIAAITSCTNTADLAMLVTAALLARAAGDLGLAPPEWVKTSFAPGSPAMLHALRRGGLIEGLEATGFHAVGIGCTTCIGNSGPLAPAMARALARDPGLSRCAVLSGNRNFPGRVHGQIADGWLVSPPLVVAFALAGRLLDLTRDAIGTGRDGAPVRLGDIWPSAEDVEKAVARCQSPINTTSVYSDLSGGPAWRAIEAPDSACYPWDPASTYLRRPTFVRAARAKPATGPHRLALLAAYGDDVSTDHISPAGAIPAGSEAAAHLIARGEDAGKLNVYAARRGNFEVMERGAFTSAALVNLLCPEAAPGHTRLSGGGPTLSLRAAAARLRAEGRSAAILAGARYGQGSSRDWAAKAPALLGVRVILAASFERIHRSNLIGMGIWPVELPPEWHPAQLSPRPGDHIEIDLPARARPGQELPLRLVREDGATLPARGLLACLTAREAEILAAGGIIPDTFARRLPRADRPARKTKEANA